MKKFIAMILALVMVLALGACTVEGPADGEKIDITLWTYPIGNWGDEDVVNGIIAEFNKTHPNINVTVQYLDYTNGDKQVNAAIEAGTAPDIVMEGPERLVSNWGANGKMVDLSDLWTAEALADIGATSQAVVAACKWSDGKYYEYPLCMTTHCMAINYEVFEQAGALQYIDQETRTWTTEDFIKACEAVAASGLVQETGIVYCGGQGGDQGTRALINNLYSGKFTNEDYTKYTADSDANKQALNKLLEMEANGSIAYDASYVASDELQLFANGTIAMSFCWNAANQNNYASKVSFTPYAMAFPSDDKVPELCGGIWGFGIFDNGNDEKIAAAKEFIKFVCDDKTQGPKSVYETGFFPVRKSFGDIYAGTEKAYCSDFNVFMPYLGDYYNVAPNWANQRTAWWTMLQAVFTNKNVDEAVATYIASVNN